MYLGREQNFAVLTLCRMVYLIVLTIWELISADLFFILQKAFFLQEIL